MTLCYCMTTVMSCSRKTVWLSLLVCSVQDEEEIEEEERREKESKAKSEFDKIQVRTRAADVSILLHVLPCLLPIALLSFVAMQSPRHSHPSLPLLFSTTSPYVPLSFLVPASSRKAASCFPCSNTERSCCRPSGNTR